MSRILHAGFFTQARGTLVGKRADVWAFGCLLYELLTGQKAFRAETVSDTLAKVLERAKGKGRILVASSPQPSGLGA